MACHKGAATKMQFFLIQMYILFEISMKVIILYTTIKVPKNKVLLPVRSESKIS